VEWHGDVMELPDYDEPVDVVFHLAGVSRYDQFLEAASKGYDINVIGTLAVLTYCKKVGARCVFASTSGVYRSPMDAEPISEDAPLGPNSPYGISKGLAEGICRHQAKELGTPSVVLRLFNVYGPGQHPSFLIMWVIECLLKKQPIVLRMPDAFRDFVYVADVVDAFSRAALLKNTEFKVFNIGRGQAVRVRDVVRIAERVFAPSTGIELVDSQLGELTAVIADNARASEELGWTPKYNLEAGLMEIKASLKR
jgi:nucleoside-diphosphate-sugar epimerase|tara:strand:- start:177 stop:935 length:759 start_codon:yes stop_codon:yes gene_type:complete